MTLDLAHQQLAWPRPDQIFDPAGSGPSVLARLARDKIGQELARRRDVGVENVRVGVLTGNPNSDSTGPLIAVVCEFRRAIEPETLREAHRLAWNFCRSPLLITLEPHLIRAWTCYEGPDFGEAHLPHAEITEARVDLQPGHLANQAATSLHWINLVSGQFFEEFRHRFRAEHRADLTLLNNLRAIRRRLCGKWQIEPDTVHDLLARIIFIQFLFDRKDSSGTAALNPDRLRELRVDGILSADYDSLYELLLDHEDTFSFFKWLDGHFNGDLFPGKGKAPDEADSAWQREMDMVPPQALRDLSSFVQGSEEIGTGALYLWPQYCFDAIPLEFISSIYEEFVQHGDEVAVSPDGDGKDRSHSTSDLTGVHYTRSHLVDFVLDAVLPWNGELYELRVLV